MSNALGDATELPDNGRPLLVMLHALGMSAQVWQWVTPLLDDRYDILPLDLPGFGDAAGDTGFTVAEMADRVLHAVEGRKPRQWLIAGHSMGGKVATVVASRSQKGGPGGLAGVILLAGSPPSPEPMADDKRREMIDWLGRGEIRPQDAQSFVDANVGAPLSPAANAAAMGDLARMSGDAWLAWLRMGSREDWSGRVGTLHLPACIIVGAKDGALGEAGQRATNLPVYPAAQLHVLPGAGHLLPLEKPGEVAALISTFNRAGTS